MLLSFVALVTIVLSALFMARGLRMVAADTVRVLAESTAQARRSGDLAPRLAFIVLWAMIFALSYL